MNRRQRRMVGIFVVVGVVMFIAYQVRARRAATQRELEIRAEQQREAAEAAAAARELVSYVVPNEVVPKRTILTDRMVRVVQVQKAYAPWGEDELLRKEYPESVDEVVGRIALVRLPAQEPLRRERLAAKDDLRAISFLIEPGKRAVTIPIDVVRGVGGFIRQGDFVDILASFPVPGGQTITKAILRKVKILIVDRTYMKAKRPSEDDELEEDEEKKKAPGGVPGNPTRAYTNLGMVTFEVTPSEAEKLVLASSRVRLTLVLRNPHEEDEVDVEPRVTIDQDIFVDDTQVSASAEPVGEVELILGTAKSVREVGVQ